MRANDPDDVVGSFQLLHAPPKARPRTTYGESVDGNKGFFDHMSFENDIQKKRNALPDQEKCLFDFEREKGTKNLVPKKSAESRSRSFNPWERV